ncbi:MAG TPA: hypothetical protein VGI66_10040 [Streptosporangiaceae bacterium]
MHSVRDGRPGVHPGLLRLSDAGQAGVDHCADDRALQPADATSSNISEANGRASVFLGAVSAGLIALGFQGAGHGRSAGTTIFEVLVLSPLVFLGLVAFGRCLEIAIDDWEFVNRITRLRAAYAQLVPELAGLLAVAVGDEEGSVLLGRRWQPLQKMLSVAGSIAVITSVVLGGDVGVIIYGCQAPLFAATLAGTAAGLILAFLTIRYQRDRWRKTTAPGP